MHTAAGLACLLGGSFIVFSVLFWFEGGVVLSASIFMFLPKISLELLDFLGFRCVFGILGFLGIKGVRSSEGLKVPWFSWPSFWLFPAFPANPLNIIVLQVA